MVSQLRSPASHQHHMQGFPGCVKEKQYLSGRMATPVYKFDALLVCCHSIVPIFYKNLTWLCNKNILSLKQDKDKRYFWIAPLDRLKNNVQEGHTPACPWSTRLPAPLETFLETFRCYFGCHNFLRILKPKTLPGMKFCNKFALSYLEIIAKHFRISGSQFSITKNGCSVTSKQQREKWEQKKSDWTQKIEKPRRLLLRFARSRNEMTFQKPPWG